MIFSNTVDNEGRMLASLQFALSLGFNFLKTGVMLESFKVSGSLFFVKNSLIQFVGLGQQNLVSFRILIGIPPADALSESKSFKTFLTVASETCWKENLLWTWNFSLILRILGWFEKLSMIPWTLLSLTLTFEDQLNK